MEDPCGGIVGEPERFAALAPDERLHRIVTVDGAVSRAVFEIHRDPPAEPGEPSPKSEPVRLISTDACGDDELPLPGAMVAAVDDGVILSCDPASGTVYRIDPEDRDARVVLLSGVECEVAIAGPYAVAFDVSSTPPRIVAVALDGGSMERILLDAVAPLDPPPVAIDEDKLIALLPDGQLVTVDIAYGSNLDARNGVADLRVSPDARYMLVQQGTPSPDEVVSGPVVLVDRQTGGERVLIHAALAWSPAPWFSDLLILAPGPGQPVRVFTLPYGEEIVLPEGTGLRGTVGDGRLWIGVVPLDYGRLLERTWNPATGESTLLYDGEGFASGTPDGLFVHVPSPERGIQLGTLMRVPWDGGAPAVAAADIGWHRRRMADGRWLSVVGDPDDDVGALVLHEVDGTRRELDTGVHVHAPALTVGRDEDDPLVYTVREGTASGLYRVRL